MLGKGMTWALCLAPQILLPVYKTVSPHLSAIACILPVFSQSICSLLPQLMAQTWLGNSLACSQKAPALWVPAGQRPGQC